MREDPFQALEYFLQDTGHVVAGNAGANFAWIGCAAVVLIVVVGLVVAAVWAF